jgi:hypothetical protein
VRESSKVDALEPLRQIAGHLTADEVIDRLVPYLVSLFKDESAQVRAASFELLVQVVCHMAIREISLLALTAAFSPRYAIVHRSRSHISSQFRYNHRIHLATCTAVR